MLEKLAKLLKLPIFSMLLDAWGGTKWEIKVVKDNFLYHFHLYFHCHKKRFFLFSSFFELNQNRRNSKSCQECASKFFSFLAFDKSSPAEYFFRQDECVWTFMRSCKFIRLEFRFRNLHFLMGYHKISVAFSERSSFFYCLKNHSKASFRSNRSRE